MDNKKDFCPNCGEDEVYYVSQKYGKLCKDCAKEKIKFEDWVNLNLKTLFSLEDDELISEVLSSPEICYCPNCGYFDFEYFKESCPKCGYKEIYEFANCFGGFKKDEMVRHLEEIYSEVPSYVTHFIQKLIYGHF